MLYIFSKSQKWAMLSLSSDLQFATAKWNIKLKLWSILISESMAHQVGASLMAQVVKNPPANAGDLGLLPGSRRSPGEGKQQLTPIFLLGQSHGQRSLVGSPWGHKRVRHELASKQQHTIPGTPTDSHDTGLQMLKKNCMTSVKMHQRTGKSTRKTDRSNKLKQRLEFR